MTASSPHFHSVMPTNLCMFMSKFKGRHPVLVLRNMPVLGSITDELLAAVSGANRAAAGGCGLKGHTAAMNCVVSRSSLLHVGMWPLSSSDVKRSTLFMPIRRAVIHFRSSHCNGGASH